MKIICLALLFIVGCGAGTPPIFTAYGKKDGVKFTAPDLCAALAACYKAGEEECLQAAEVFPDVNGGSQVVECRTYKAK